MALTCIIVEDELMARKSLQRLCENHGSLDLMGVFDNPTEALSFLAEHSVDLIWLDVEMPDLTGFDLLEKLPSIPLVVLTTSKTEYAFDAFQYQVTDYIKKPITMPRFNLAVEKVLEVYHRSKLASATERQEIYVKSEGRYIRIPFDAIAYVENIGDYVKIHTDKQTHIVYTTMKYLEEKLGSQFLRVHRSYIVHLDRIVDIEENTLVINNKVIPISRANKPELMSRLNLL
ncbi:MULTISPECIES: LytR/AlgR family response regulator transcription factor [Spirosoma]|uniref:LytTR family DNA-binding domain-containing protein n=1 Tax=Spirosoma liriopis TaxID=2937440 RepID=A0ABT0HRI3_9BACT|nr:MULTISPECIES: LytTR family DNA-binding domain-containing protein [Spirosoma]MCK8494228.1 LytTR family DNA-binding domain-containing protein [Spirosoma liriopis]UHG89240.1 LytTR family DNA-binding domain-containing protein [Spirosoma oryzicola]